MDHLLASKSLAPGMRFHPTDVELFMYYLKRKVLGKSLCSQVISEVDVYRFAPWDLHSMSSVKTKDLNWYFFCPRTKKYANGGRANRATECGFWKSTGNDRTVMYNGRPVGKIKTLIFHLGKPPKGDRTNWVMYEYRLEDRLLADDGIPQDSYVICKVYEKSGLGPRNGEHRGAPFVEEEWESDDDDNMEIASGLVLPTEGCGVTDNPNSSVITNVVNTLDGIAATSTPSDRQQIIIAEDANAAAVFTSPATAQVGAVETGPLLDIETEDEVDRLLALFTDAETRVSGIPENGIPSNDIFGGLDDLAADGFCSSEIGWGWSFLEHYGDSFLELNDLT